MLKILFWTISILAVGLSLYQIFIKKNIFGISTYILLGVYLPLFMSFADWSAFHVEDKCDDFYYIFMLFGAILALVNLLPHGKMKMHNMRFVYKSKPIPTELFNLFFIAAILVENYYVSGYFNPSAHGIDVHTARMPYIYFITTGVYMITILNLVDFLITKRKRYVLYMISSIAVNVVTKSARIDAAICVVQIVSVCIFYYFSKREVPDKNTSRGKKKSKLPFLIVMAVIVAAVVLIALNVGNNRMNHYGKYELQYSDGILYDGPQFMGEVMPYYYGYFALSFDNLAYNLAQNNVSPNYIGLNTFRTLWFGVLQFDNLFGLSGSEATRANVIRCKAAAVATGFWDMFYDYEYLVFIPFIVMFLIYMLLRRKVTQSIVKAEHVVLYFYWVPLWFLLSFDNRVFDYQVLWHVVILYFLIKSRYKLVYEGHPEYDTAPVWKTRKGIRLPRIKMKWKG